MSTLASPILDPSLWAVAPAGFRKSPFPAFGGKSRIAPEVWVRIDGVPGSLHHDPVRNFIEPFCFSAAVLWKRPIVGAIETINDRNVFVSNFWRAVRADPDAVALHADWPVIETDLHARHRWLVGSDTAAAALDRVRGDPEAFDARIAGWWCWGACCWIGSGWCDEVQGDRPWESRPHIGSDGGGNGVNRVPEQLPDLSGDGSSGRGVHAPSGPSRWDGHTKRLEYNSNGGGKGVAVVGPKRAKLTSNGRGSGVHATPEKRPRVPSTENGWAPGVIGPGPDDSHRPQLADEFARGRGVNGHDQASACADRSAWLRAWMRALSDRLRPVRVCCGHWDRVCDSPSTMTRLGTTGVFLDPPYRKRLACGKQNRTSRIYANDRVQDVDQLCDQVQAWCLRWGQDPAVRIALCGLEGEYPEIVAAGWTELAWKSNGGYGNRRGAAENENARRERVWFSPHCLKPQGEEGGLFA